jgi:chromosome segregation ATPase
MLLFKSLLKVFLKWLLTLFAAAEDRLEVPQNGNRNGAGKHEDRESQPEILVNQALHHIKQAVDDFEDNLNRKAEKLSNLPPRYSRQDGHDTEINDLHAELAELKADIRFLKRTLEHQSEVHENRPQD